MDVGPHVRARRMDVARVQLVGRAWVDRYTACCPIARVASRTGATGKRTRRVSASRQRVARILRQVYTLVEVCHNNINWGFIPPYFQYC